MNKEIILKNKNVFDYWLLHGDEGVLVSDDKLNWEKKYNISQAVRYLNPEIFKEELDKCICVCMNCHAKLHDRSISLQTY